MAKTNVSVMDVKYSTNLYTSTVTCWQLEKRREKYQTDLPLRTAGRHKVKSFYYWFLVVNNGYERKVHTVKIGKIAANNLWLLPNLFSILTGREDYKMDRFV
jgi:hypothetical protein